MFNSTKSNIIFFFLLSFFSIFATGFISFIYIVNTKYNHQNIISGKSNFVVVATGGSNRLLKGLDLMKNNYGKRMLLTGIGKGITKENISKAISANEWQKKILDCCVDFDETAIDTKGNALKAKKWIQGFKTNSIFLVSANYHMPRLYLEMQAINPKIKIITVPVKANSSPIKFFWKPENLELILNEYFKLLATYFRLMLSLN